MPLCIEGNERASLGQMLPPFAPNCLNKRRGGHRWLQPMLPPSAIAFSQAPPRPLDVEIQSQTNLTFRFRHLGDAFSSVKAGWKCKGDKKNYKYLICGPQIVVHSRADEASIFIIAQRSTV